MLNKAQHPLSTGNSESPLARLLRRVTGPSLLVLHLDTRQLEKDGFNFLQLIHEAVPSYREQGVRVEVVATTTLQELRDRVESLKAKGLTFDFVTIIGHGHSEGIRIASDRVAAWGEIAELLQPFTPKKLMLLACESGRWPSAKVLFDKLGELSNIFACPVVTTKVQAELLLSVLPLLLVTKSVEPDAMVLGQLMLGLFAKGQMRHWTRDDMNKPMDGVVLDLGAQLLDLYIKELF